MEELAGMQSNRGEEVPVHRENGGVSEYQNSKPRMGGRIWLWIETEGSGEAWTTMQVGSPARAIHGGHCLATALRVCIRDGEAE